MDTYLLWVVVLWTSGSYWYVFAVDTNLLLTVVFYSHVSLTDTCLLQIVVSYGKVSVMDRCLNITDSCAFIGYGSTVLPVKVSHPVWRWSELGRHVFQHLPSCCLMYNVLLFLPPSSLLHNVTQWVPGRYISCLNCRIVHMFWYSFLVFSYWSIYQPFVKRRTILSADYLCTFPCWHALLDFHYPSPCLPNHATYSVTPFPQCFHLTF